ncbi:MAG: adenylosuccinate lyase [Flavobacteriaceae bacterium]|nr:adenylosuccinate lyase [Flavobacteriaceae bacterium]
MASRVEAVALVIDNLEVLPELIEKAFSDDKNHFKYCWWLEFLNRQYLETLCPYITDILKGATHLTNDSAIRPIAKIIERFTLDYYSKNRNEIIDVMMTSMIKEKMIELCFQWLIDSKIKVATSAYSMTSLFHLGKDVNWVHPELRLVIEQSYATESVAYQARARMILKKLKK